MKQKAPKNRRRPPADVRDLPGGPWTITYMPKDTQDKAKVAANRAGKYMSDWLNEVILKAAHEVLSFENKQVARVEDNLNLAEALRKIEQKIEQLDKPFWKKLFKK